MYNFSLPGFYVHRVNISTGRVEIPPFYQHILPGSKAAFCAWEYHIGIVGFEQFAQGVFEKIRKK